MKKPPVVFIAGERQHAGKTVTSLGLISALCNHIDPADIGYFKPVGQEMVTLPNGERIDKDVRIVQEFTGLDMPDLSILSPVRVVSGVTREYIASTNPRERTAGFEKAVQKTLEHLSDKKLIIAEGTGHPGVGSVIGMSNARVANMLDARSAISVTERASYIGRVRNMSKLCAEGYVKQREKLGFPLLKK